MSVLGIHRGRGLIISLSHEIWEKLMMMAAWRSSGEAETMLDNIASCNREKVREVLGVSKGNIGRHRRY